MVFNNAFVGRFCLLTLMLLLSISEVKSKKHGISAQKVVNMGIPDESKIQEAQNNGKKKNDPKFDRSQYKAFLEEEQRAAKILGQTEKHDQIQKERETIQQEEKVIQEKSHTGKLQGLKKQIKKTTVAIQAKQGMFMEYMMKAATFIVFISMLMAFVALVFWWWKYYRGNFKLKGSRLSRFGNNNLSHKEYQELMDDYVKRKDSQSSRNQADVEALDYGDQRVNSQGMAGMPRKGDMKTILSGTGEGSQYTAGFSHRDLKTTPHLAGGSSQELGSQQRFEFKKSGKVRSEKMEEVQMTANYLE